MSLTPDTKFYVFVQSKGGWNTVKEAADSKDNGGNEDGIVSKAELLNYMQGNQFDFDKYEFERAWTEVDYIMNGKIEHTRKENLGHIDEEEGDRITTHAEQYGAIIDSVNTYFSNNNINLNGTGINQEDLIYQIVIALLVDGITAPEDSEIASYVLSTVKNMIKTTLLKKYGEDNPRVNSLYTWDGSGNKIPYNFVNDPNLSGYLDNYLGSLDNDALSDLGAVYEKVKDIIEAYLNTAGLIWRYQAPNTPLEDDYQYNNSYDPINDLQKARLYTAFSAALTTNALAENTDFNEFAGWEDALSSAAKEYIKTQQSEWATMTQQEFWKIFGNGTDNTQTSDYHCMWRLHPEYKQSLQTQFLESSFCTNLQNVINIAKLGGADGSVAKYNGEWAGFYNVVDEPGRFPALLKAFGGFDTEMLKALFMDQAVLNSCLQAAYKDIMENPYKYDIENLNNLTPQTLQNAMLKYFKDNLASILTAIGYDNADGINATAHAYGYNALGAIVIHNYSGNENYGNYDINEIRGYVNTFINYVKSSYSSDVVSNAVHDLETYMATNDNEIDWNELHNKIQAVLNAIDKENKANASSGTSTENNPPEFDDLDENEITNLVKATSLPNNSTRDKVLEAVKKVLRDRVLNNNGIDEDLFNLIWEQTIDGYKYKNGSEDAEKLIRKFVKLYNTIKDINEDNFVDKFTALYENSDEDNYSWGTGRDTEIEWNAEALGITNPIDPNSLYGKINTIGQILYNGARYMTGGKERAWAAYQTFMSYYKGAIHALESYNFNNKTNNYGEEDGSNFPYTQYSTNGSHTNKTSEDNSRLNSWSSLYLGGHANKAGAAWNENSGTGMYIAYQRHGDCHQFKIYLKPEILAEKFLEFWNSAV